MVSIECIERGLARYVNEELLPSLPRDGAKGFAIGVAASLLVKRGGNLLREYAKADILRQMGLVSADGAVDLDAIREAAKSNIPPTGLAVDLPMGICLRVNAADVDKLYDMIRQEARL